MSRVCSLFEMDKEINALDAGQPTSSMARDIELSKKKAE